MKHVFIVGSKGIPTKYGGFETFVDKLTEYKKSEQIQYHVSAIRDDKTFDPKNITYEHNGAQCFCIKQRISSAAKAIFYDVDSIKYCLKYVKENNIEEPVIYVLACRIGPYIRKYKRKIHRLGGKLYVNPDGHEWKRSKWSKWIRRYWKRSEKKMVKHADLIICDNEGIEQYIQKEYAKYNPKTKYIAYGAETSPSTLEDDDERITEWYEKWNILRGQYYLMVGRFVPENNYEIVIKEFMKSDTKKDLVVISDHKYNPLYDMLIEKYHIEEDPRIKFVGTLYNYQLLKKIRENAYGYIHGHSVGGTNPSLLEALGRTDLNLVFDVSFNKEVAGDGAIYFTEEYGLLRHLINKCDQMTIDQRYQLGLIARGRVDDFYSWDKIANAYEALFLEKEKAVEEADEKIKEKPKEETDNNTEEKPKEE